MEHYDNKQLPNMLNLSSECGEYLPSDSLKAAFDVAIELNMPLLLTGEPGTGKTCFAYHIADYFPDIEDKVYRFDAKTTSSATDLFYSYDALKHFHLVQNEKNKDIKPFEEGIIKFEALGEIISKSMNSPKNKNRSVLLIDEIDKAPRDFPNDLLNVMEGHEISFTIPELQGLGKNTYRISSELKPIIIITSNSEKNLPDPFLRRCVFHHISFPKKEKLLQIVEKKLLERDLELQFSNKELSDIINEFGIIRDLLKGYNLKTPATAELISWIIILGKSGLNASDCKSSNQNTRNKIINTFSSIAKSDEAFKAIINHYFN